MPDEFDQRAADLMAQPDVLDAVRNTDAVALTKFIAALLRSVVTSRTVADYTAATVAARADERKRALDIAHAVVDRAAGDTTLGQTIIKRLEQG